MPDVLERRISEELPELRMSGESGAKKLSGYFGTYNSRSGDLGGFVEVIKPGAFNRNFGPDTDIRALSHHERPWVIGRTKAGSLKLGQNARGATFEIDPIPDTTYGRDLVVQIESGLVDGMSFAFRTITDNWKVQDGINVRELVDVRLIEVSPVTFPAYPATSVSLRSELEKQGVENADLCAALVRLEKKLDVQERDASLITEYRSIIPERFGEAVEVIVKADKRSTPLDVLQKQLELIKLSL